MSLCGMDARLCPMASDVSGKVVGNVGDVEKCSTLRLARMHTLHLPGGSNFDPPGSTCC